MKVKKPKRAKKGSRGKRQQRSKVTNHEKDFIQTFKGCCKIYLNDVTPEAMAARNVYTGDWQTRRGDIFATPRKFKVVVYAVSTCGVKADPVSYRIMGTGDSWELSQIIFQTATARIDEWLDESEGLQVNTTDSYAVIKV